MSKMKSEDKEKDSPEERELRRLSALNFCRNTMKFVVISIICAIVLALGFNHWDAGVLKSKYMLIFYVVEFFIFFGGINVAMRGWQEK
jgi:hypothetical protein